MHTATPPSINVKQLALLLGPIVALMAFVLMWFYYDSTFEVSVTVAVTVWVVLWWIFEPIPIPVTSLLPLSLLPLSGVLSANQVASAYGHPLVLLLLGGFLLATALESCGAHQRLAIAMVRIFGTHSPRRVVFGFMAASAVLSMWISNTATVIMLLPVAIATLKNMPDEKLAVPLLLGIAWGASIGGMGTPIGTPPNIVFMGIYEQNTGTSIAFGEWMMWTIPIVMVLLPLAGFWLTRHVKQASTMAVDLPRLGLWTTHERRVMVVFVITALAWITRQQPFGGWSGWVGVPYSNDAIVAFLAVVTLFVVPNGKSGEDAGGLLNWEQANRIPWGMLILFGAGISIATAFVSTGLSATLGEQLKHLSTLHLLLMMGSICLLVTFLTEVTSNTATTTLLMPILAAAAIGAQIDPLLFMVPAALSASCAFMLPVATPPNLIVFSSGHLSIERMVREGFAMNLMGVVIIATGVFWVFS